MVSAFAPAKINLTLHVTGQSAAGYHLLDSLVAFASVGDDISISPADQLSLSVSGPEAEGLPTDTTNLALRAATLLAEGGGAALHLTKRLPVSSGIGGGSADAAAALRALLVQGEDGHMPLKALWAKPDAMFQKYGAAVLELGADVPMCLLSRPVRARGVGEKLSFLSLPPLSAVLVNPRVPVTTRDVFASLEVRDNSPMPADLPALQSSDALIGFLSEMRNDLEVTASRIAPAILDTLAVLRRMSGCRLARMSGSGATCFGLFEAQTDAGDAATAIREAHPDWWVADCWIGDQFPAALPIRDRSSYSRDDIVR